MLYHIKDASEAFGCIVDKVGVVGVVGVVVVDVPDSTTV
jgi:hypothetical protein